MVEEWRTRLMKSTELNENVVLDEFTNALDKEDNTALAEAMVKKYQEIENNVLAKFEELKDEHDSKVLASRGIRQLTNAEVDFYKNMFRNDIGMSPVQGGQLIMPKTIFDSVFDDLREDTSDNILAYIDLQNTTGASEWLVSVAEKPVATWGELCDPITKELSLGFKVVNSFVNKLSCYIPYCKSLLELGPVWQDAYVREYIKLGLKYPLCESAISGNGQKQPWGMAYDYDIDTDTGTLKTPVAITSLSRSAFKDIFKTMSINPMGLRRSLNGLIMVVDPVTYYDYIYANEIYYDLNGVEHSRLERMGIRLVVCDTGLEEGQAIVGLPKRYFMQVAMKGGGQNGMVEFSDDYLFLEDKRVYKAKLFADGFAKDQNAFALLDVTGLTGSAGADVRIVNTDNDPVVTREAVASV